MPPLAQFTVQGTQPVREHIIEFRSMLLWSWPPVCGNCFKATFPDLIPPKFDTAVHRCLENDGVHLSSGLEGEGVFETSERSHWKMPPGCGPGWCCAEVQLFCWSSRWKTVTSFEEFRCFPLFFPFSRHLCKTLSTEVCNWIQHLAAHLGSFKEREWHLPRLKVKPIARGEDGSF